VIGSIIFQITNSSVVFVGLMSNAVFVLTRASRYTLLPWSIWKAVRMISCALSRWTRFSPIQHVMVRSACSLSLAT
jgi:hypothetical protein